jgi:hypothetical protein
MLVVLDLDPTLTLGWVEEEVEFPGTSRVIGRYDVEVFKVT